MKIIVTSMGMAKIQIQLLIISKKVLADMGLTEDNNKVILKYDEKKKEMNIRKV